MTNHSLGLDPGFGGFKVVEATGEGHHSVHLPSVVGVGDSDTGLLSLGTFGGRRIDHRPVAVSWNGRDGYFAHPF